MALPEPLRASAQHIGLLHDKRRTLDDKRRRLVDAQVSAELQFLAALRREAEAGETSWTQLRDGYAMLSAGKLRGLRARWMDAIGSVRKRSSPMPKPKQPAAPGGKPGRGSRPHGQRHPLAAS
jgi:hypothetical protein